MNITANEKDNPIYTDTTIDLRIYPENVSLMIGIGWYFLIVHYTDECSCKVNYPDYIWYPDSLFDSFTEEQTLSDINKIILN